jgi:alkanesulfonate monooxygenase SsuD/methylene tetrahydromethanopterin reductase-like flavin-dependent oxidoreductase (luciferase family)
VLTVGVTIRPAGSPEEFVRLGTAAERNGFTHVWSQDSHMLWLDSHPLLALLAARTDRIRVGQSVTNPITRDLTVTASSYATLHRISDGRAVIGLGRGDSACYLAGLEPARMRQLRDAVRVLRDLVNGRSTHWRGHELRLLGASTDLPDVPLYVAGYGPETIALAGRCADGLIMQVADPVIVAWMVDHARNAAERSGRDPASLRFIVTAPSRVTDDLADARAQTRWVAPFLARQVAELVRRHGDAVPYGRRLEGAERLEVDDQLCDRLTLIGPSTRVRERLQELQDAGADQVAIQLVEPRAGHDYMTHMGYTVRTGAVAIRGSRQDAADTLDAYGRDVIPYLAEEPARSSGLR